MRSLVGQIQCVIDKVKAKIVVDVAIVVIVDPVVRNLVIVRPEVFK